MQSNPKKANGIVIALIVFGIIILFIAGVFIGMRIEKF
jgi:hypothetical protein